MVSIRSTRTDVFFPSTISISIFDTKHNLTNCITIQSRIPSTRTPRSHSRYQPPSHHHHHLWKSSSLILFGSTPTANQNCIVRPCRCHSTCTHHPLLHPHPPIRGKFQVEIISTKRRWGPEHMMSWCRFGSQDWAAGAESDMRHFDGCQHSCTLDACKLWSLQIR